MVGEKTSVSNIYSTYIGLPSSGPAGPYRIAPQRLARLGVQTHYIFCTQMFQLDCNQCVSPQLASKCHLGEGTRKAVVVTNGDSLKRVINKTRYYKQGKEV